MLKGIRNHRTRTWIELSLYEVEKHNKHRILVYQYSIAITPKIDIVKTAEAHLYRNTAI